MLRGGSAKSIKEQLQELRQQLKNVKHSGTDVHG
jgi:hypothetical protein